MDKIDIERITDIINRIRNARADLVTTTEELDEFRKEQEKIEDQIEGREDDVKSITMTIEDLEEELIELTKEDGEYDEFGQPRF